MSLDLFPEPRPGGEPPGPAGPLADRLRPDRLDDVVGQEDLLAPGRFLPRMIASGRLPSLIFWGPPGTGKTTLAILLARAVKADFVSMSATGAGVREIRDVVGRAARILPAGRQTILFIDEIHRFNRGQQDALLPHVERGIVTLIGATTENPSFEVNAALLSRSRVVVLKPLSKEPLERILGRALQDRERGLGSLDLKVDAEARRTLTALADGDARRLLNILESASGMVEKGGTITAPAVREAAQSRALLFDKAGDEHYNLISALHKSIRDSDPDGALYWLARLLLGGEDRLYVARRLMRIAVEDIGLASPSALTLSVAARDAVHFMGIPEGDLALAELAVYLSLAPKSNAIATAFAGALLDAERYGSLPVPLHLRNPVTGLMAGLGYGKGYRYAHDDPAGAAGQRHLPEDLGERKYYKEKGADDEASAP